MKAKNAIMGAKVMIKKSSRYYDGSYNNPKDSVGTINRINKGYGLPVGVAWEDGHNTYNYEDLKLVKEVCHTSV